MFRFRNRRQKSDLPLSSSASKKKSGKWLAWTNIALGALIPLSIGIGTVIITVVQQKNEDQRQNQERELDDRRYVLDQLLANLSRQQDQQAAETLHYQNVYRGYVQDISSKLYTQQLSSAGYQASFFVDDSTKFLYLRSQTLTALRDLDWERRTEVFLFLYYNKLLPRIEGQPSDSLDLSDAILSNITVKSTSYKTIAFEQLSLISIDLSNSSFIQCHFYHGVNFAGSSMTGINFSGSVFSAGENTKFTETILTRADFSDARFDGLLYLKEVDLTYAGFCRVRTSNYVYVEDTKLMFTNFTDTIFDMSWYIHNTDMTGAVIGMQLMEKMQLNNVILPNKTWVINEKNFIMNGDAEKECLGPLFRTKCDDWNHYASNVRYAPPTLSMNQNLSQSLFGKHYFNLTSTEEDVGMSQFISFFGYSVFVLSKEAVFEVLASVSCVPGSLELELNFYNKPYVGHIPILTTNFVFSETAPAEWHQWRMIVKVPVATTEIIFTLKHVKHRGVCYVDNIELFIRHEI